VPWLQEGGQVRLAGSASMDVTPIERNHMGLYLENEVASC
jgi:hypothetical protein